MSDPGNPFSERRNHAAPFWSIMLVFFAILIGLAAYGYFDMQTVSNAPGTTTGQSAPAAPAQPPPAQQH
jgi:phosphate/sulfate permease